MVALNQEFEATKAWAQEVCLRKKSLGGFFIFNKKEGPVEKTVLRSLLQACGAVVLALGLSMPVSAAIPLITDDTGTQGKGKFQCELAGEYSHDEAESVTNRSSDLSATLTYGPIDAVDIVLSIPYQAWGTEDSGAEQRGSGISDIAVETKWRFYEQGGLSLALKPGLTIPTGNEEKELGNGKMTYYLYFIASGERNPWAFHLNLAYIRNDNTEDDRKDIWRASFASTVDLLKNVKLAADAGVESNADSASKTPLVYMLVGLIYSPRADFDIGLGVKGGLTRPEPDVAVRGGITYRF